jgi:hypothetical protein
MTQGAGLFGALVLAELAEAVAALLTEVRPRSSEAARLRRRA